MRVHVLIGDSGRLYKFQILEIDNSQNGAPEPDRKPGVYAFAQTLGENPILICIEEDDNLRCAIAKSAKDSCVEAQHPKFVLVYLYQGTHRGQTDVRDVGARQYVVDDLRVAYSPLCRL